jgi:hypothetical protein
MVTQIDVFGLDAQIAAQGHGVPGIQVQIYQYLFDLSRIDPDAPDVVLEMFMGDNFLAGAGEHFAAIYDKVINTGLF